MSLRRTKMALSPEAVALARAQRRRRAALAALSGVMLGFSFPPFPLGLLACFGLVPLLLVLAELDTIRSSLTYGYLAMLVFHVITLNWTGGYAHMRDPYMMLAGGLNMTIHPLFYLLPLGAYAWIRRRMGETAALAALPAIWVGYEYSHSLSEWSFPWLTLGNSQSYDIAGIQFISVTGIWGLSFWILLINVGAYVFLSGVLRGRFSWRSRKGLGLLTGLLLLLVLPRVHGALVLADAPPYAAGGLVPDQPTITVGMVQANIDPWEKWRANPFDAAQLYLERTRRLASGAEGPRPDIVFWPETAIPYYLLTEAGRGMRDMILGELTALRTPVLTGLQHAVFYRDSLAAPRSAKRSRLTGERYDVYNAAALLEPGDTAVAWYGKMKMVPLAERVPYADAFAFLDFLRWDVGLGGWQIGPGQVLFRERTTGTAFSTVICYESTYPGFVASFVRGGAEFLGIITIDSWWAKMSGAYQHHQFALFRAVENRRWIARCAAGGISSYIDPYGRVYDATELFTRRDLSRTIGRSSELTVYTRFGDWLGQASLAGSGIVLLLAAVRRRGQSRRTGTA